jgi:hypothetical protein
MKNNNNIIPTVTYNNMGINKSFILSENKGKSGVYQINNLNTNKNYIGSAIDISKRLKNYYQFSYLDSQKNTSIVYRALLKHGYYNFSLDILEYCEPNIVIKREQYYIDALNPEYNILKVAGSRLGSKHSKEAKAKMSINYVSLSPLRKINHLLATGHITTIINKKDNSVKLYDSIRSAARDINISHNSLLRYINKNILYKGVYQITTKSKN